MATVCKKCGKEIEGSVLQAEDADWHPECFVCDDCGGALSNPYNRTDDDKRICGKCNKARIDGIANKCVKCGERITGEMLTANEMTFHPACFSCSNCGKAPLGTPFFPQPDGQQYCEKCNKTHKVKDEGQLRCAKCNDKIEGKVLNAEGKDWHPKCLVCDFCAKPLGLEDGSVEYATAPDGKRACTVCAEKLANGTMAAPVTKAVPVAAAAEPAAPAADDADYKGILTHAQLLDGDVWKPLGVKASTREKNLSDAEFQSLFEMDKAAFAALPKFKQETLKKKHKLF